MQESMSECNTKKYMKKKRMYELLKQMEPELELPLLRLCSYKFYRGSEWLEANLYGFKYEFVKIYHYLNFVSIDFYYICENCLLLVCRKTYRYDGEMCELEYCREYEGKEIVQFCIPELCIESE